MNSEFFNIRRIAVISDTHGHLPAELAPAVGDVDLIIHAGDIDRADILKKLKKMAPVLAVRGNMDRGGWTDKILPAEIISINGMLFYVLHDLFKLDIAPETIGVKVVISGHTHRPAIEKKNSTIYVNPGSVSQPRGGYLPSFALITVNGSHIDVQIKNI